MEFSFGFEFFISEQFAAIIAIVLIAIFVTLFMTKMAIALPKKPNKIIFGMPYTNCDCDECTSNEEAAEVVNEEAAEVVNEEPTTKE